MGGMARRVVECDVAVAGGGPAGLSAAAAAARKGLRVIVFEQNREIGSPVRTSGGSFVEDLQALGIPSRLYHVVSRARFLSPNHEVKFAYDRPRLCIIDVHATYQFLATEAIEAGARMELGCAAKGVLRDGDRVTGIALRDRRGREFEVHAPLVIDATGHRSVLLRDAGLYGGCKRFGVGAEYDLHAPSFDRDEAVLIVGSRVAPSGYAWAFPWGDRRVRLGVGVIHPDVATNPDELLDELLARSTEFGMKLHDAQPLEVHHGLIPSEGPFGPIVGEGILGAGDAAGQPSALLGEGIRWAILAGRLAGRVAAEALASRDVSAKFLRRYEDEWTREHGTNLKLGYQINKRIATYSDDQWDEKVRLLDLLTPEEFLEALRTNLAAGWIARLVLRNPSLLKTGFSKLVSALPIGRA
jgi:digeranylgeranylglycerophospholipid reductase